MESAPGTATDGQDHGYSEQMSSRPLSRHG